MKKRNIPLILGSLILLVIFIVILFPEKFANQSPYRLQQLRFIHENGELNIDRAPYSPDDQFILGSDYFGRDIYSYIIYGTKMTISLGILVALGQFIIAVPLGIFAGFGNRIAKSIIRQFNVVFSAIPALLIAIILLKLDYFAGLEKEKSIIAFVIVLSMVSWAKLGGLLVERVESILKQAFIKSEVAIGKKRFKIALENVIPHLAPELIVLFFMEIARSLSMLMQLGIFSVFVGNLGIIDDIFAGLPVNLDISLVPEWASMLSTSRTLLGVAPWAVLYPALAFFISVLGFNLFGEGLRTVMQKKDSRSVLVFRKFISLDFKYLWSNFKKESKVKIGIFLLMFLMVITTFLSLNHSSYKVSYQDDAHDLPDQVVIGTEEANNTARLIANKMKDLGVKPLGDDGYLISYDIGQSNLIVKQSFAIKVGDRVTEFKSASDYAFLTSGNIKTKGLVYDATKDDLYNLKNYAQFENKYILIDKAFYNDAAIQYFIDEITENINIKGILLVARSGETIGNNIVKAEESLVIVQISKEISETIIGSFEPEILLNTAVKELDSTGNNLVGIYKGLDPYIGDEAIVIGLSYNYLEASQSSVLEFNLKLMERLCEMSGNDRSLIFLFLDGTINEGQHGIHSLAEDFPYSSNKVQVYIDLTGITSEKFGEIEFSVAQAPMTRPFAWSLGNQLEILLNKNKYPIVDLEARYIDGSYYFMKNRSDNALFWNRGMPTIILSTIESDGKTYDLETLGSFILEVINQNNY